MKLRIVTPTALKTDRDNPSRMSEITFYGIGFAPATPAHFLFDDKIAVEVRPYRRTTTMIVKVSVREVVHNSEYRSVLCSLLGTRFGRLAVRRIRSHRRWNTQAEQPYVSPRLFERTVDNVVKAIAVQQAPAQGVASQIVATP